MGKKNRDFEYRLTALQMLPIKTKKRTSEVTHATAASRASNRRVLDTQRACKAE